MSDKPYYSPKEAAEITGASRQIIRVYTETYRRFFSTEGAPEPGQPRKFTRDDLRLIRYIYLAAPQVGHAETAERLAAGALEQFDWQPPEGEQSAQQRAERATEPSTYLVPVERLQAAQTLLEDAQRREQAAQERAEALQAEVQRLSGGLGRAQGKLEVYEQRKRPRWLQWLAGE